MRPDLLLTLALYKLIITYLSTYYEEVTKKLLPWNLAVSPA